MASLGNFISPQGAANLANHKYSGVDQSILGTSTFDLNNLYSKTVYGSILELAN
jgi:hypothetical protein